MRTTPERAAVTIHLYAACSAVLGSAPVHADESETEATGSSIKYKIPSGPSRTTSSPF